MCFVYVCVCMCFWRRRRISIYSRIIIIIIIYLFTGIGLLPGGSGYFSCKHNMNLDKTWNCSSSTFSWPRHSKGVGGQRHAPSAIYPQEIPGTHCTGGWLGTRAGLDRCGKSRPHRVSISRPSRQITQKKAHNIQKTEKVWNEERVFFFGLSKNIQIWWAQS
jgi:hypothetical protein